MLKQFLSAYSLSLLAGMAAGLAFGDLVFPVFGKVVGELAGHVILAIGGAFLAAVVYELVTFVRGRSN